MKSGEDLKNDCSGYNLDRTIHKFGVSKVSSNFLKKKKKKQHSTFFIIVTKDFYFKLLLFCTCMYHIRLISEGSCDTEDWSNDAENSALNQE